MSLDGYHDFGSSLDTQEDAPPSTIPSASSSSSSSRSASGFEKRGVTLLLLQRLRDCALSRDQTKGVWTIGRMNSLIIGNHEILKPGCRYGDNIDVASTITYASQSSLIDMLQKDHRTTRHPVLGVTYDEVVREKSNVFLSFAYSGDFFESLILWSYFSRGTLVWIRRQLRFGSILL